MNKSPYHRLLFLFIFATFLVDFLVPPFQASAQDDSGNKIFIADLDCSAGTTISMLVRGVDGNGTPLAADMVGNSLAVFENGQPVTGVVPVGPEEAPKYVIFAFDRGVETNLENFRADIETVLRDYANNYFKEGIDTIQFLDVTIDDAIPATPITTIENFDAEISNIQLSPTGTRDVKNNRFEHLDSFFKNLSGLNQAGRYSMAVIYFTRIVEKNPDEANIQAGILGAFLKSKNIAIHVVNTDRSGIDANVRERQPFLELAEANGGQYLPLEENFTTFPKDALSRLFQTIKNNAQSYRVRFPATVLNAEYSVGPVGINVLATTDKDTCMDTPTLSAPEVLITKPSGSNPKEFLTEGQTTISVQAALQNWDGTRRIAKVELLVDDVVVDKKEIHPDSTSTIFALNWNVSTISGPNPVNPIIAVRVTDQFGTVGTSPEMAMQVYPFVATPTPTPKPPPIGGGGVSDKCEGTPFTPSCIIEWIQGYIVWILLAVIFVVLLILFNTNRKLAAFASSGGQAIAQRVSKGMEQVRKTLLGGTSIRKEAIAYLNVLVARPDRAGGRIEIYNNRTTLGRDPKLTDIQLYNLDDQSSVSGLHCTIFFDQGKFFITDDNSSNGTFLNSKRLGANDPTELPNNAEITLGDLYRQGAKLIFEIATGSPPVDAYPIEEPDFHVDLSDDGSASYSPPPRKAGATTEDDFRKTIPGYREDIDYSTSDASAPSPMKPTDTGNKTDIFHEPPPSPPPIMSPAAQPAKPKPAQPKKKGDDGWMKDLG